jgi:hypothetical protein
LNRWRSIGSGLLVSLVSLVILDIGIGLVCLRDGIFLSWFVPPYDLIFTERQAERVEGDAHPYVRFDQDLGWTIRPNGKSDDGLYHANSAGFRANREYALRAPAGVLRVASFGDSFTHGAEVGNRETWEHLLESHAPHLEVLNFGVDAYGVDQAFLRYRKEGSRFAPDVVLIGLLIENINRSVSVYRPAYYHRTRGISVKPRFRVAEDGRLELIPLPVRSREELMERVTSGDLLEVLKRTDYWVQRAPLAYDHSPLFWSSIARIVYGRYENSGRNLKRHYAAGERSEPFRVTLAVIQGFHDEALQRGARQAIAVVFPDARALREHLEGGPAYWQSMVQALEARGVPVVDMGPALVEAARDAGVDHLFSGYHYSGAGNAVVARALEQRLVTPGS